MAVTLAAPTTSAVLMEEELRTLIREAHPAAARLVRGLPRASAFRPVVVDSQAEYTRHAIAQDKNSRAIVAIWEVIAKLPRLNWLFKLHHEAMREKRVWVGIEVRR